MRIRNYSSGEVEIVHEEGQTLHLDREASNRLIMTARMHTVAEFADKLPNLISEPTILATLLQSFQSKSSSQKWTLKENFARLPTMTKDFHPTSPVELTEEFFIS